MLSVESLLDSVKWAFTRTFLVFSVNVVSTFWFAVTLFVVTSGTATVACIRGISVTAVALLWLPRLFVLNFLVMIVLIFVLRYPRVNPASDIMRVIP